MGIRHAGREDEDTTQDAAKRKLRRTVRAVGKARDVIRSEADS